MAEAQHEPTMEEILASIRKIISDDTHAPEAAIETESQPVDVEPESGEDADILELTQEIHDEATVPQPPAAAEPVATPEPIENDLVFEQIEEPKMADAEKTADDADADIFSDKTRAALDDAFAGLDNRAPETPAPTLPGLAGNSVEAVFNRAIRESFEPVLRQHLQSNTETFLEAMKPLIREWMDENFPPLLETAVRGEVARAVRARSRR